MSTTTYKTAGDTILATTSIEAARAASLQGKLCYLDTHPNGRSGGRRIRGYVVRRGVAGTNGKRDEVLMETVVLKNDGTLAATL